MSISKLNIQRIPIEQLKPADYNPRQNLQPEDQEYKKIMKSIIEYGCVIPLVINKDYTVIRRTSKTKNTKRFRL